MKPDAYPPFSKENVSDLVEEYATGPSIQALVNKPHRFEDLIDAAFERLDAPEPPSKSVPSRSKASTHKAAIVIEPSSEPEHDEEEIVEDEEGPVNGEEDEDDVEGSVDDREVEGNDGDVVMDVAGDDSMEKRENAGGREIMVKAEEHDEVYALGGGFRGGEDFDWSANGGRSTPQSTFSLEVDGLEIVSTPQTRSGSLEPHRSRGPSSPSSSLLSID